MAKLYFRYGAMNSGKSTALMQVAHNYEEQGMQVLILKPQVDTKGGDELVSRLGVRRKADLLVPPEVDVFEAVRTASRQQKLMQSPFPTDLPPGCFRMPHTPVSVQSVPVPRCNSRSRSPAPAEEPPSDPFPSAS